MASTSQSSVLASGSRRASLPVKVGLVIGAVLAIGATSFMSRVDSGNSNTNVAAVASANP